MFVNWIMSWVKIVPYSIVVNGIPSRHFHTKKDPRQGDLMSLFLFGISMEYLSRWLGPLNQI